jgi:polynucleotide 5'-hydroxyl-kinase GRC3/NOL9
VEKAVQMISDQSLKMSNQTSRKNLKIFLVCGEKNQGKTTLSQMIANNILLGIKRQPTKPGLPVPKVFFLETDLGQPVFSLPGFITMLQMDQNLLSNCTNTVLLEKVICSKYFGDFSPETSSVKYLTAITDVYSACLND